jgi:thiosulfate reductase cytochrome b subunit
MLSLTKLSKVLQIKTGTNLKQGTSDFNIFHKLKYDTIIKLLVTEIADGMYIAKMIINMSISESRGLYKSQLALHCIHLKTQIFACLRYFYGKLRS